MHPRLNFDISWPRLLWAAFGFREATRIEINRHRVFALSMRTLFDALLAGAGLAPGAPVILSGINIENMADIVRLNGFAPHPVDIDPATLLPDGEALLAAQARTGAKICLIAHLFGAVGPNSANMVEATAELRRRGVLVIHDLAQGYSREGLTHPPDGDVTLLSFGPIKRRTALGGALAVVEDPALAARLRARLDAYPLLDDAWFRARARKYLMLKALSHPALYGLVFAGLSLGGDPDARIGKLARGFSGGDLLVNIRHRPPPRLLHLLLKQIAGDPELPVRRRICDAFLAAVPPSARVGPGSDSHVHWLVPVRVPEPDAFIQALRRRGFDATRGATSLRALAGPDSAAAALIDHVVYLPHPADMRRRARMRLRDLVLRTTGSAPDCRD